MKMANYDGILMLFAITNCALFVNGKLLNTLEDLIVIANNSVQLSCRSDVKAEIQWYRGSEYLYAGGKFYAQNNDRFRMDTDVDQTSRTYTLIIREARHGDAGVYSCREDEGRGQSSSANITIMTTRLLCESNMHANGYIGPNTCNLQQENMTFSCSVSFIGTSPRLVWRASNDNSQPINSSVCDHQPNRVNCQLTLTSDPSYDGTFVTCLTAQTSGTQYNCSTKVIKVQYFALDHELKPVEKIVDEEVECSVKSNLNPRFEWSLSEDNQETVVSNTQQHVIRESGLYWCNVSYNVRDVQCSSTASVIYAATAYPCKAEVAILVIAIIAILIFIGAGCFIFKKYKATRQIKGTVGLLEEELRDKIAKVSSEKLEWETKQSEWEKKQSEWEKKQSEWEKKQSEWEKKQLELEKKLFQPLRETVPYEENPVLVKTILTKASRDPKRDVNGIAILEDKLFAVSRECKELEVYELNDLKNNEEIAPKVHQIEDLKDPRDMVSCSDNNCLYIRNYKEAEKRTEIFRISPAGKVVHKWVVEENTGQLSVGNNGNVLVAVWNGSKVIEYTCDGKRLREIQISKDASIVNFRHVISLQSGYFVLCHGNRTEEQHRLCIIGDYGRLIKSFGTTPGSSETQVNLPAHLARDRDDAIIVADRKNQRVLLLTPQLKFKRELLGKKNGLVNPWRVCLDMERGFLFVADNKFLEQTGDAEGRIHVYKIIKSNIMEGALQTI